LIQTNDVLLKNNAEWLHFSHPHHVISTQTLKDVRDALEEVEQLVNQYNWHAAGFLSYEAAPAFDSALHVRKAGDFPLLWFGLYDPPAIIPLPVVSSPPAELSWVPSTGRESYNIAIEKIKDLIAAGHTYQVNYSMRLTAPYPDSAWDLFLALARYQNKYGAYIDTGRHVICSASPELFFELEHDLIKSSPMKGTAPRGRTTAEDRQQIDWLKRSEKNRAENVMIVDMIRNDIGQIAQIGSVRVPELFRIEKFPSLFQMTSTVEARTQASVTAIFSGLFPCGSVTGAPKVSTMKIISDLETTPRKVYTGSIGFIAPQRRACFNVAIRTVLIDRETKVAEYGAGGGVVWDSTSSGEYDEALLKARVLTEPAPEFSLFETLLWTAEEGYFLLERHAARMQDSADYFDFIFSSQQMKAALEGPVGHFNSSQRVKITLDRSGAFHTEFRPFDSSMTPFKACLAREPVHSNDPFLFHKTTNRKAYEETILSHPQCSDVLFQNERGELTEFSIGNLVVDLDGSLFTPPAECGLLPGTFRAHLLETGRIKERIIQTSELGDCKQIFLINSVRKWVEVNI
jgi:para-aminobenzoate synthetase/4-amino-4-deoxychorismate lyase